MRALAAFGLALGFALGVEGWDGVFSIRASISSHELSGVLGTMRAPKMSDDRFHPKILPRSIPRHFVKGANKYAETTGTITWASNRLQSQLAMLFAVVITSKEKNHGPQELAPGIAIWNALKSDGSQRDILKAAIVTMIPAHRLLKRLIWSVDMAGKLASYRNDAIHTPVMFKEGKKHTYDTFPEPFTGQPARVARLLKVGHQELFRALIGDLLALGQYVNALRPEISNPGLFGPLPQRPKMQAPVLAGGYKSKSPGRGKRPRSKLRRLRSEA